MSNLEIEHLPILGCIVISVRGMEKGSEEVTFTLQDGRRFQLYHEQDCCEGVEVYDIEGNPSDLVGSPLTIAEATSREADATEDDFWETATWTFYRFATRNGYVTLRWLGTSNGFYSESVDWKWLSD